MFDYLGYFFIYFLCTSILVIIKKERSGHIFNLQKRMVRGVEYEMISAGYSGCKYLPDKSILLILLEIASRILNMPPSLSFGPADYNIVITFL